MHVSAAVRRAYPRPYRYQKYRGVNWETRASKWRVQITVDGIRQHVGYYDDEEDAARAFDDAARAFDVPARASDTKRGRGPGRSDAEQQAMREAKRQKRVSPMADSVVGLPDMIARLEQTFQRRGAKTELGERLAKVNDAKSKPPNVTNGILNRLKAGKEPATDEKEVLDEWLAEQQ